MTRSWLALLLISAACNHGGAEAGDAGQTDAGPIEDAGRSADATVTGCLAPGWSPRVILDTTVAGTERYLYTDVGIDHAGHVHVAYVDGNSLSPQEPGSLIYLTDASGSWVSRVIDTNASPWMDLEVDDDGFVHIAYTSAQSGSTMVHQDLRYATNRGGSWHTQVVDPNGSRPTLDLDFSLEVDSYGNAHITYDPINFDGNGGFSRTFLYATNGVYYSNPTRQEGSWSIFKLGDFTPTASTFTVSADGVVRIAYTMLSYLDATLTSDVGGTMTSETIYHGLNITYGNGDDLYEVTPRCVLGHADDSPSVLLDDTVTHDMQDPFGNHFTVTRQNVIEAVRGANGQWTTQPMVADATVKSCTAANGDDVVLYRDFNRNQQIEQGVKVGTRHAGSWHHQIAATSGQWPRMTLDAEGQPIVFSASDPGPGMGQAIVTTREGSGFTSTVVDAAYGMFYGYYPGGLFTDDSRRIHAFYMVDDTVLKEAVICAP